MVSICNYSFKDMSKIFKIIVTNDSFLYLKKNLYKYLREYKRLI